MLDLAQLRRLDSIACEKRKVFLRLDLNVPMRPDATIADDSRIRAALPTISLLQQSQAQLVVASHLGRPAAGEVAGYSLRPVADRLRELLGSRVHFVTDCVGPVRQKAMATLAPGEVLLLENTRFYAEESANEPQFAAALAEGMEVYINDAFATLHRQHASTAGMAGYFSHKAIGLLVGSELAALTPLLSSPHKPFTLILGGAKVSGKIELVRNLLSNIDRLLIGGGMAFTFLRAEGKAIGSSLVEAGKVRESEEILKEAARSGVEVYLPEDFCIRREGGEVEMVDTLGATDQGLDIGPKTTAAFVKAIAGSATLFWNGPLGVFEQAAFRGGTLAVAKEVVASKAHSVIGGGDTLAAFKQLNLLHKVQHASTGGGATLAFLAGKRLPGLQALL